MTEEKINKTVKADKEMIIWIDKKVVHQAKINEFEKIVLKIQNYQLVHISRELSEKPNSGIIDVS